MRVSPSRACQLRNKRSSTITTSSFPSTIRVNYQEAARENAKLERIWVKPVQTQYFVYPILGPKILS